MVDRLVGAASPLLQPSTSAVVVAWLGGVVHFQVYDALVASLNVDASREHGVLRSNSLVRLIYRGDQTRLAASAEVWLSGYESQRVRDAVISAAASLHGEIHDGFGLVCLLQPVWLISESDDAPSTEVCGLLEQLAEARLGVGDGGEARRVAEFLAASSARQSQPVSAHVVRLLDLTASIALEGLTAESIIGTESQVRLAAALLRSPSRVNEGLERVDALALKLDQLAGSGEASDWRLLLAHRLIGSGHPTLAANLLAPLLASDADPRDRARAEHLVLSAAGAGELLLERAAFEERYEALEPTASDDERLPIIDALADLSHRLGDYRTALTFGAELFELRCKVLGADHPDVLTTRNNVAFWRQQQPTRHPSGLRRQPMLRRPAGRGFSETTSPRHSGCRQLSAAAGGGWAEPAGEFAGGVGVLAENEAVGIDKYLSPREVLYSLGSQPHRAKVDKAIDFSVEVGE